MSAPLTVLMPMAGLGSRFAATGVTTPKPLIEVSGLSMFQLALLSVRAVMPRGQTIGAVLGDVATNFTAAAPGMHVLTLPALTGGALETCLAMAPLVHDTAAPILVLDCDLTFTAPGFFNAISQSMADGMLLSFTSAEPRFSYAEVAGPCVLRTAEKQVISSHALIGAYMFRSAALFFALARGIIDRNETTGGGEFYVSSAYNALLAQHGSVEWRQVEQYWSMGTPAELAACLADPGFTAHTQALKSAQGLAGT